MRSFVHLQTLNSCTLHNGKLHNANTQGRTEGGWGKGVPPLVEFIGGTTPQSPTAAIKL